MAFWTVRVLLLSVLLGVVHCVPVTDPVEPIPNFIPDHALDTVKLFASSSTREFWAQTEVDKLFPNCKDDPDTATCNKLFATNGTSTEVEAMCVNPNFQVEAIRCAETCKLCGLRPEYNCANRPQNARGDHCVKTYVSATDPKCQTKEALEECAQFCARCDEEANCKDKHTACSYMADLCEDADHILRMHRLCPATCSKPDKDGETGCKKEKALIKERKEPIKREATCADTLPGCSTNVMLCEDEQYIKDMKAGCQLTCGYCVKQDFDCKDTHPMCNTWSSNGFCDLHGKYPKGVILQHCPRLCKYCT